MKKLIEITELKVGDVIVYQCITNEVVGEDIQRITREEPRIVQGIMGDIIFTTKGCDVQTYHIEFLKRYWKKQVEQERWRAEKGCSFEVIDEYGAIQGRIDDRQRWHNELFNLGNYFKPGEAQKHVEAFKGIF